MSPNIIIKTKSILPLLEAPLRLGFKPLTGPLHSQLDFPITGLHF